MREFSELFPLGIVVNILKVVPLTPGISAMEGKEDIFADLREKGWDAWVVSTFICSIIIHI